MEKACTQNVLLAEMWESRINIEDAGLYFLFNSRREEEEENSIGDNHGRHPLHVHKYAEMFVCLGGKVTITTQTGDLVLSKGDFAVVPTGIAHVCRTAEHGIFRSVSYMCVHRKTRQSRGLFIRLSKICHGTQLFVFRKMESLCREVEDIALKMTGEVTDGYTLRMAAVLMQIAEMKRIHTVEGARTNEQSVDMYRVSQIDHVLSKNYKRDICAQEMAQLLYVSTRHLERIMCRHYGMTWRQAVNERRLEEAARMLCETDLSAERIGTEVGFCSKTAFYREFARKHGKTPHRYRRENK